MQTDDLVENDNQDNEVEYEVFVGELNFDATEDDVKNFFSECG